MDEKLQDELEQTAPVVEAEEEAPEAADTALTAQEEYEPDELDEPEEEPDEIFFTSDFVMDASDFNETVEFAYLNVANNSLILSALIVVFTLSSLLSGKSDYLMVVPIIALVLAITQARRYANTDKEITNAHATIVYRAKGEKLHYHLEFGEYIHTTNNGLHAPKRDLNEVQRICESENYWLLCLEHQLYVAVKKDSISGENPNEFIPYLQQCCKDMKNKKIVKVTGKKKQASIGVVILTVVAALSLILGFLVGYVL